MRPAIVATLLCAGCMLTLERQQAADRVLTEAQNVSSQVEVAARQTSELLALALVAPEQRDPQRIAERAAAVADTLTMANAEAASVAQIAAVMLQDFGDPPSGQRIQSQDEADAMLARYRAKAEAWRAIRGTAQAALPIRLPALSAGGSDGWTGTEIGGVASAVVTLLGAFGVGAIKVRAAKKATQTEADGRNKRLRDAAVQAEAAIEELKGRITNKDEFKAVMSEYPAAVAFHREKKATEAALEAQQRSP
jgi:hypothetical protein